MLERILNEGNEQQRGNGRLTVPLRLYIYFDLYVLVYTDAHQVDVVLDEIDFLAQRHMVQLTLV